MRRILLSVAAVALSLALAATAEAGPKGGGSKGGSGSGNHMNSLKGKTSIHTSNSSNHYQKNGVKLKGGGYCFKGKNHHHWSSHRYDKRYGCYCYYDSDLGCSYYWCEPDDCYYPMSYCPYGKYSWSDNADGGDDD
jgi:hypothetical protein